MPRTSFSYSRHSAVSMLIESTDLVKAAAIKGTEAIKKYLIELLDHINKNVLLYFCIQMCTERECIPKRKGS